MFAGLEFYPYGYLLLFLLGAVILLCGLFFKVRSDRKNESVVSHKDSADVPFKAVFKEWDGLPEELAEWGTIAVSKIVSLEKRHEAAEVLRNRMDTLWNDCISMSPQEKVKEVLEKLGDAESAANDLKETYQLKKTPQKDRKIGIIMLVLSGLCSIYPFMAFFVFPNNDPEPGAVYMTYRAGVGAGAGWAIAIVFFVIGIWALRQSVKDK